MNKTVGIIVVSVLVILGAVGLVMFMDDDNANETATQITDNQVVENTETVADDNTADENTEEESEVVADKTIELNMKDFEYSLDTIEASPGDVVSINLSVGDDGPHNFVIDQLDVESKELSSGETETVTFTIPEDAAGQTYAYYCNIGDHRAMGMEGQLVISN